MNAYPIFLKSYSLSKIESSKPQLPEKPQVPSSPKLIKKNWLERTILYTDESEDRLINLKRTAHYLEALIEYEAELKKYNERIKVILSETNVQIYRDERKRIELALTVFADLSTRETLKGRYEPFFPLAPARLYRVGKSYLEARICNLHTEKFCLAGRVCLLLLVRRTSTFGYENDCLSGKKPNRNSLNQSIIFKIKPA